eukprot:CAMPEP_0113674476 /NCGR_PEP_ID=MMETSP0038_2-20120614/7436_1 /TAXON_ID=2898 /ORGANISM="Cryptomonas paramecium" /LENGTH=221 /DNA_ID=CAMNT_0000591053 /DNA_START=64 /DNA_END=726 /DNA_ORIENTATION=- /assembly_acc=CAM_ASM_000170
MHTSSLLTLLLGAHICLVAGDNFSCALQSDVGYADPNVCDLVKLQHRPFRVAFIDKQYVTQNSAAVAKAKSLGLSYIYGRTCENVATALPECFVASNWGHGWIGKFMWGVFSNYLGLTDDNIIAMTTVNFTSATDPKNKTSVYKGSSSYTRCVWEVNLGNIDMCVMDSWETMERRAIAQFTTALAVDRFKLITVATPDAFTLSFPMPSSFDTDSMGTIFQP